MLDATERVEAFYERVSWKVQSGQTGDADLLWPSDTWLPRYVSETHPTRRGSSVS